MGGVGAIWSGALRAEMAGEAKLKLNPGEIEVKNQKLKKVQIECKSNAQFLSEV
ncbi:MAG TPA: hypothetical protein HA348_07910 [Thermoplasmata archaeon]|nr:hypothetical protein [Thermoplasmata archaeon]